MLRRPFCGMAAAYLLGVLTAAYGGSFGFWQLVLAVMAVALAVSAGWLRKAPPSWRMKESGGLRWRIWLGIIFIAAAALLGFGRYSAEQESREAYLPYLSDGMRLSLQGRLSGKEMKYHQYIYELTSCVIGFDQPVPCNRVLVYSDSDIASIGEILVFDGTVALWKSAVNEGNFNSREFHLARKTDFSLNDVTLMGVHGRASRWREGLWKLRLAIRGVYESMLSEEEHGVLSTMVLGDKELLDEETRHLYQTGGLSHVMAISGLHISVVGMTLYGFFRKRGVGFWMAGLLAGTVIYAYGVMSGMGTSVQRAVLMFFLMLLGQALGKSYDTLNALGVAALFLLWQNPYLTWDAGFQFSFAAVLGVAWVGSGMTVWEGRLFKLFKQMFPGVAIQLATLPLVAWHYFEVPVYAVAVNFVVLPFTGILLASGIVGGFAGLLCAPAARILFLPCRILLKINRFLCGFCEGLPGALWITGRPSFVRIMFYYALLAAVTSLARNRKRKRDCRSQGEKSGRGKNRGYVCAVFFLVLLLCVPQRRDFTLAVLDVGQGDGAFLRTGEGHTLFVDGGSSDVYQVGKYRILPFLKYQGVRQIDFWLVSHVDEDHVSGLKELLTSGYPVRHLLFSAAVVKDEAHAELVDLAEDAGTAVVYLDAGETLHLGSAALQVLFPTAKGSPGSDRNAASLVAWYEEGSFSGIFTGDIGNAQESQVLEQWRQDGYPFEELDFYKAAHHGSNYSNSEEFLQVLRPEVSVVSCGAKNSYGHPGAEAIAHMEEAGSRVYYTMESGQITVTVEDGEIVVREYLTLLESD